MQTWRTVEVPIEKCYCYPIQLRRSYSVSDSQILGWIYHPVVSHVSATYKEVGWVYQVSLF